MNNDMVKLELAKALRSDPRQRFYLTNKDCKIIIDIILDHMKRALKEGRGVNLGEFGRISMERLSPRRLFNYKLRKTIDVPISFQPKIRFKPEFKYELKKALLKLAEEEGNDERQE